MPNRLANLRVVDPVLTNLARGYTNSQLIAGNIFPTVSVPKEAAIIPTFGKDSFKIYNTQRALRAASNVISPEGIGTLTLQTMEHDIAYPVDYRESKEAIFNLQQYATKSAKDAIDIGKEKEAADLVQNTATYPSGSTVTLASTAQWSDSANSLPIDDIKTGMSTIRSKIGKFPNLLVLGYASYDALTKSTQILNRIKYSQKGIITTDILKAVLAVPDNTSLTIVIGLSIFATDAGVFTDIWNDNAILAYVSSLPGGTRTPYDPSFGYNFERKSFPFADRYMGEGGKVEYVRFTDNYQINVVGSDAGYLIANTVA